MDSDAPEIETVRVPAGLHRSVRVKVTRAVIAACPFEQAQLARCERVELAIEILRQLRSSGTVLAISSVVLSPRIVEKREELDDLRTCTGLVSQAQTVYAYPSPMPDAMNASPVERELLADEADEALGNNVQTSPFAAQRLADELRAALMAPHPSRRWASPWHETIARLLREARQLHCLMCSHPGVEVNGNSHLLGVALGAGPKDKLGLPRARTERTQNLPRVGNPTKQGLDHQEARLVIGSRQVTAKRLGTAVRQEDA